MMEARGRETPYLFVGAKYEVIRSGENEILLQVHKPLSRKEAASLGEFLTKWGKEANNA